MTRELAAPLYCPVPSQGSDESVTLAHGEGGTLSRRLIQERIARALASPLLDTERDAALLPACRGPLAMTTDSFVVSPLFFPGGDIGSLAVYGTANDLAVARPTLAEPRREPAVVLGSVGFATRRDVCVVFVLLVFTKGCWGRARPPSRFRASAPKESPT